MQREHQIYAVDGWQLTRDAPESIVILIYAQNAGTAKNRITVYQQQNQLRLQYSLLPLPLETYFQRHGDETLIEPIRRLSQQLAETNPLIIFNPHHYQASDKTGTPCLIKTRFPLRAANNSPAPSLFQSMPDSVKPYLWPRDDADKCYVIINAETSFWFPIRFEQSVMRFACLYKGEKAEKQQKTAPYLLELPANHPFAQELFSDAPLEQGDGFQHWRKNFGFFFRSSASFDELHHHFRKFIYMPTYQDNLLYFRFYHPQVLEDYLDRLIYYPKKLATFFGGGLIDAFLLPKGDDIIHYMPNMDFSQITPAKKQFDKFEMDIFIAQRNQSLLAGLANDMLVAKPILADYYDRETIEKAVHHCYQVCHKHGIYQTSVIGIFSLLSLACGSVMDIADPQREINRILQSQLSEQEKLYEIKKRFAFLVHQGIIQNKLGETHG